MQDQPQMMDLRSFGRTMLGRQPGYKPTRQELAADIALYKEYQKEAIKGMKPSFTPSASEVALPDGRKIPMLTTSPNSAMVAPSADSWSPERITAADGTVKLVDKNTGRAITAWDEQTGAPVKAPVRSGEDAVKDQQTQILAQDIAKLQAAGAPWYQSNASYQKEIAAKQAQLNAIYNPQSMAGPAMAPAPTPTPSPSPTPSPTPAPEAAPAQAPTPDAAYLSSPVPAADPAPAPSMDPATIKAAYKAGQLTREQAVGMLKSQGY